MKTGIADRIETLLKERGVKQRELSQKIGVSSPAISSLKKTDGMPSADTALKIACYFGVDPMWLVFGDNVPEGELFSGVKKDGIIIPVEEYKRLKALERKVRDLLS